MFFFEGTDKALSKSILCRLASISHTDLNRSHLEQFRVFPGGILHALVRMENQRSALLERHLQGGQCELFVDVATDCPTSYRSGIDIKNDGQIDEAVPKTNICDI